MAKKKDNTPKVSKEDFVTFLSRATPEDLNKLIREKGKPPKYYTPVFFFNDKSKEES